MKLTTITIQGSPGGTITDKKFVICDDAYFYNIAKKNVTIMRELMNIRSFLRSGTRF